MASITFFPAFCWKKKKCELFVLQFFPVCFVLNESPWCNLTHSFVSSLSCKLVVRTRGLIRFRVLLLVYKEYFRGELCTFDRMLLSILSFFISRNSSIKKNFFSSTIWLLWELFTYKRQNETLGHFPLFTSFKNNDLVPYYSLKIFVFTCYCDS